MKHQISVVLAIFIAVFVVGCKSDTTVNSEPVVKKPIVIKEITFPNQNKTRTPPPSKPNKPSTIVDSGNLKQAFDSQQRQRDNNIKMFRQELRQNCLRGLKDRPILKFKVNSDGSISSFGYVSAEDQESPLSLDESIIKCTSRIIKKTNLGILDIELPNRPKMKSINVSLPM